MWWESRQHGYWYYAAHGMVKLGKQSYPNLWTKALCYTTETGHDTPSCQKWRHQVNQRPRDHMMLSWHLSPLIPEVVIAPLIYKIILLGNPSISPSSQCSVNLAEALEGPIPGCPGGCKRVVNAFDSLCDKITGLNSHKTWSHRNQSWIHVYF